MKKIVKIFLIVLIISFIVLSFIVSKNTDLSIDKFVYTQLISLKSNTLTNIVKAITELGGTTFLVFLTILSIVICREKIYSIIITANVLYLVVINQILKNIIQRPRPSVPHLVKAGGFSFPSGHAMVSAGFYGFLIFLINISNINKKIKNILTVILTIIIILVGMSRVYLGVHYFTDVLAGFILAVVYLLLFTNYVKKYLKHE